MTFRLLDTYRRIVLGHPLLWLLLAVAVTLAMAAGMPRFKLDASADSLTLEHDESLDFFRETYQRFGTGDVLVVTYTPQGDLFTDENLNTLDQLAQDLAQVDGVASVLSIADVPLLYSPPLSLSELGNPPRTLLQEDVDWEQARDEFWNSPIYRDTLLGPDGKTTAVLMNLEVDTRYVELVRERDGLRAQQDQQGLTEAEAQRLEEVSAEFLDYRTERELRSRERVADVRAIVDSYRDRADLFVGGATMITSDMVDFIRHDLVVFGVAVVAVILLVLFAIFRQPRFVLWPLLAAGLTTLTILGFLSWIDWRLTVISSNFVALLLIMTMSLTVHLVVRYRETCLHEPELSHVDKMTRVVEQMGRPCLYNVLTTMVAFVSLVVSDIRPVIDFGWMMTIGLSIGFAMAFIVVPCGLLLTGEKPFADPADRSGALTLRFSAIVERWPNAILVVYAVVIVAAAVGLTRLTVENRFIDYFDDETEIYRGMSVIDRQLGGTMPLDIVLSAPAERAGPVAPMASMADGAAELEEVGADLFDNGDDPFAESAAGDVDDLFANDPFAAEDDPFADDPFGSGEQESASATENEFSYWWNSRQGRVIERYHEFLEAQPEIGKVVSLATGIAVARDLIGSPPNDIELSFMRKMLGADLERVLIAPYLDDSVDQTRISMRIVESDPDLQRGELIERVRRFGIDELGLEPGQVQVTGLLVLYNNMLQSLFHSQIMTLGAVFLAIMAMFLVLFRSLKLAFCGITPSAIAALAILGGMGLYGLALDMMTITIAAITIGIGVDNAIHYIYRFQNEFGSDRSYVATMHRAHGSIGRAMYYTSMIIVLGFSVLALSEFVPTILFGLLTGVAMLAALLGSLLLLPRLLMLVKPFGPDASADANAGANASAS